MNRRFGIRMFRLVTTAAVVLGGVFASTEEVVVPVAPLASDSRPAGSDAMDAFKAREYPRAIFLAERAIDDIEANSNRYDPALVLPLVAFGDALGAMQKTDTALEVYNRARHVIRVNNGLYSPEQVDVIYREARLLTEAERYRSANDRYEYAYELLEREYEDDDLNFLEGTFVLADWYMDIYNIYSARELFNDALQTSIAASPAYDKQQLRALRGIAKSYWYERYPPNDIPWSLSSPQSSVVTSVTYGRTMTVNSFAHGERALLRAIHLVRGQTDTSEEDIANTMLDLADWYLVFDKYNRAYPLYRHVYELLHYDSEALDATFGEPTPLYLPLPREPMKPIDALSDIPEEGLIELMVSVNKRGFVSDIETIRSEPGEIMDYRLRRSIRSARYRPMFTDDGLPVEDASTKVLYTFSYYLTERSAAASSLEDEESREDKHRR